MHEQYDLIINYGRVSSLEQSENSNALIQQLDRLNAAPPLAQHTFYDELSGDNTNRPQYQQCLSMARQAAMEGKRVMVRVARLDRWGRNNQEIIRSVEEFDGLGVTLYSLDGGIHTVKEANEWLQTNIQGIFAQYFLKQLSANISRGNEYRRQKGRPLCNTPPYGYRFNEDNSKLEPDPATWEEARKLIDAYLIGKGLRDVTAMSSHFNQHTSLRQWLMNPTLAGDLYYTVGGRKGKEPGCATRDRQKEFVYNCHAPLITREEQRLIEQRMAENKRRWGNNKKYKTPVLSGLVVCSKCGYRMGLQKVTRRSSGTYYRFARCQHPGCYYASLQEGVIEEAIQEAIAHRAEEVARAALEPKTNEKPPELLKLEQQREQVVKLREQTQLESLDNSIEELDRKIAKFEKPTEEPLDLLGLIEPIANTELWEGLSDEERRSLYLQLVKRILVKDKQIERIELTF
ncbi:MAG: recombinase family protein [Cyanobacteria bacterium P01_E01_bin.6]